MSFDEWWASLEADEPGQYSAQDCVRGVNIKGLLRVCWNAATAAEKETERKYREAVKRYLNCEPSEGT